MDDEAPRLVYNPDDGSIELRTGARGVTVDGLDTEVVFERMTPDGDAASPLWLAPAEADVLRKMIGYIIDKVRITEGSKGTLAELLPRVQAIAGAAITGTEGEGSAPASGSGPAPGSGEARGGGSRGAGGSFGSGGGVGSGRVVSIDRAQGSGTGRAPRDDGPPAPTDPLNVPGVRRGMPPPRDDDRDDEDDES